MFKMKRRRDNLEEINVDNFYSSCSSFWKNYAVAMKWQKDFISHQRQMYYHNNQEFSQTETGAAGSRREDHKCSCAEDDRESCGGDDSSSNVEDDIEDQQCIEDKQCSCVEDDVEGPCVEDHKCSGVKGDRGSRCDDMYLCTQDDDSETCLKDDERGLYVEDDANGNDDSSMEIEVSEEFLEYLRSKMRKQKEADAEPPTKVMALAEPESKTEEKPQLTLGNSSSDRRTLMYGESACMIAAMEAAMDVNFAHFSRNKKVVLWPVLPIKF